MKIGRKSTMAIVGSVPHALVLSSVSLTAPSNASAAADGAERTYMADCSKARINVVQACPRNPVTWLFGTVFIKGNVRCPT